MNKLEIALPVLQYRVSLRKGDVPWRITDHVERGTAVVAEATGQVEEQEKGHVTGHNGWVVQLASFCSGDRFRAA